MSQSFLFTSESVTEGHPDKVCDQISDAVLDAVLSQDHTGRVACETLVSTGLCVIAGEITTTAYLDFQNIARGVIEDIGYIDAGWGFGANDCAVLVAVHRQSPDIAQGVDPGGAGDQGMMFGYACKDTPELMPAPICLAHKLTRRLAEVRREGILPWVRPDGKSQVSIEYKDDKPVRVEAVVVSTQHNPEIDAKAIHTGIMDEVIKKTIPHEWLDKHTKYHINPTGRFVVGGPHGDSGLTGRKIIVDTYGGFGRHGGGAFSGKDPSKVDRSAAYAMRHIAKNVVAASLADRCEVQVAYAIGCAEPVSISVETFGTGKKPNQVIAKLIKDHFDLTPKGIIERLQLRQPIYRKTTNYGHFGRDDQGFAWERLDYADKLK